MYKCSVPRCESKGTIPYGTGKVKLCRQCSLAWHKWAIQHPLDEIVPEVEVPSRKERSSRYWTTNQWLQWFNTWAGGTAAEPEPSQTRNRPSNKTPIPETGPLQFRLSDEVRKQLGNQREQIARAFPRRRFVYQMELAK